MDAKLPLRDCLWLLPLPGRQIGSSARMLPVGSRGNRPAKKTFGHFLTWGTKDSPRTQGIEPIIEASARKNVDQ